MNRFPAGPSSVLRLTLAGTLALAGCNDPVSTGSGPTHLEILQDVPSVGLPDAPLLDTLRVRLVDDDGRPQEGQLLTWVIRQGGGSVAPLQETTDADGVAAAIWTLGAATGANEVEARTPQDSAVIWRTNAEAFRVDRLDSNYGLGCGLKQGNLWCWGQDSWVSTPPVSEGPANQWQSTFPAPGLVAEGRGYTDLAVGFLSVCALDPAGTVECFGHPSGFAITPLPAVPPMRRIAGGEHSRFCGLTVSDSTAWCWYVHGASAAPVPGSPAFVDLEMEDYGGHMIACGRVADSSAACWGDGPLGDGTYDSSATPVPVSGGLRFAELAAGANFACGRQVSGDVWCWGRNGLGQLGTTGPDSPVPVLATTGVGRIAIEWWTVLALAYGTPVRWGEMVSPASSPVPLAPVPDLPIADFSANDLSCMRLIDGQVYCFQELWLNATTLDVDLYSPVQPVVEPAP